MSEQPAISLSGVGKMYKVFNSRFDSCIDALGFRRFVPWRRVNHREFWALRGVDLEVPVGRRFGIIGCNGAGKTTLLKLITGNFPPTEGSLAVRGRVHALMTTGAGFHPEFTGRQNIEASLIYQGLSPQRIADAIQEIADFTELETFLDQPFKTYSAGMQARLTFATATTLTPDILIIDEILGAGDGYFIAKSTERITRLVKETGATVLLVSHALDQTVRFCEETIWLDRGRIVRRGPTLEVVKAYEQFLRVRNERRLKAKNRMVAGRDRDTAQLGLYNNHMAFHFTVDGPRGGACDVAEVTLRENGEAHERIAVGDAQDSDTSLPAFVQLDNHHAWSSPQRERGRHYRSINAQECASANATGGMVFYLYGFFDDHAYTADVTYRCRNAERVKVAVWKDGELLFHHELPSDEKGWATRSIEIASPRQAEPPSSSGSGAEAKRTARRWPSKGTLLIRQVQICGPNDQEQAVFTPGQLLRIRVAVEALQRSEIPVLPAITLFRLDGVLVTHFATSEPMTLDFADDASRVLVLDLPELNLGPGQYVFSAAIFGRAINEADRYDLIDRAFEFEVVGGPRWFEGAIFNHPATWSVANASP